MLADGDLPIKHENLRALGVCQAHSRIVVSQAQVQANGSFRALGLIILAAMTLPAEFRLSASETQYLDRAGWCIPCMHGILDDVTLLQGNADMRAATLRQQAYQLLRERLASGDLAAGTQLSEPDLAKQFGMSRTPVREALRQLENEGLLDYAPRFGAMVRVPERDELGEMYTLREALESYAAAEAAQKIGGSDLERLASTFQQMCEIADTFRESGDAALDGSPLRDFIQADVTFHKIIIAAAGNRYMSKILDDTRLLVRVFTATFWQYNDEKLTEALQFHRRLLVTMQNRDCESARLATVEAMRVARDNALRAWDQRHED